MLEQLWKQPRRLHRMMALRRAVRKLIQTVSIEATSVNIVPT